MKTNKKTKRIKPEGKVSRMNEPNLELMAKAFTNLYNEVKKSAKIESA